MRNSQQWWNETKNDPIKFNAWLVKQYRGEVTAGTRIRNLLDDYDIDMRSKTAHTLSTIADQEDMHASWVLQLLVSRGVVVDMSGAEDRYWSKVLPDVVDLETAAGVGAHAEAMRLERINVIVDDTETPEDVRSVFKKIQQQEVWHAQAFAEIAGQEGMDRTKNSHALGRELLGLVA